MRCSFRCCVKALGSWLTDLERVLGDRAVIGSINRSRSGSKSILTQRYISSQVSSCQDTLC